MCQEIAPTTGGSSPQQESAEYTATGKILKQHREHPLEKIQGEMSTLLDGDKYHSSGVGILKRTPSTASIISHNSSRWSGYYSNPDPRTSYLRLPLVQWVGNLKRTPSTVSTISHDSARSSGNPDPRTSYQRLPLVSGSQSPLWRSSAAQDELDHGRANKEVFSRSSMGGEVRYKAQPQALPSHSTLQSSRYSVTRTRKSLNLKQTSGGSSPQLRSHSQKQTRRDSVEDEGVVTDHSSKLRAESPESSRTESSSPPSSPSKSDGTTTLAAAEEQDDLQPMLRGRCKQLPKQTNIFDDFLPEDGEMRRRSSSLPTTTRARCVNAQQNATMHMQGITGPHSQSHSSSTSLDSETSYGSPSERSSVDGSQLSIASAASGEWLIYLLHW